MNDQTLPGINASIAPPASPRIPPGRPRLLAVLKNQGPVELKLKRVERALELLPEVQKVRKAGDKPNARVSTTDPEARVMKTGDGGFRPAWNVQISTDTGSRFTAGVDVDNRGNDYGRLDPMVDQIASRTRAARPRSASAHVLRVPRTGAWGFRRKAQGGPGWTTSRKPRP